MMNGYIEYLIEYHDGKYMLRNKTTQQIEYRVDTVKMNSPEWVTIGKYMPNKICLPIEKLDGSDPHAILLPYLTEDKQKFPELFI